MTNQYFPSHPREDFQVKRILFLDRIELPHPSMIRQVGLGSWVGVRGSRPIWRRVYNPPETFSCSKNSHQVLLQLPFEAWAGELPGNGILCCWYAVLPNDKLPPVAQDCLNWSWESQIIISLGSQHWGSRSRGLTTPWLPWIEDRWASQKSKYKRPSFVLFLLSCCVPGKGDGHRMASEKREAEGLPPFGTFLRSLLSELL